MNKSNTIFKIILFIAFLGISSIAQSANIGKKRTFIAFLGRSSIAQPANIGKNIGKKRPAQETADQVKKNAKAQSADVTGNESANIGKKRPREKDQPKSRTQIPVQIPVQDGSIAVQMELLRLQWKAYEEAADNAENTKPILNQCNVSRNPGIGHPCDNPNTIFSFFKTLRNPDALQIKVQKEVLNQKHVKIMQEHLKIMQEHLKIMQQHANVMKEFERLNNVLAKNRTLKTIKTD